MPRHWRSGQLILASREHGRRQQHGLPCGGVLSCVAWPITWASGQANKVAEALHQQLSKKEPVYKELERPRRKGKRKKRGSRPQPIVIGAKRTWSAALSLVLVTALLLAFSIGVGATGGSHYGTEGLQAIQQVEVVGAALHGIPFSFTGSRSSSHLGYGTGQASALAAVDGYSFDGYLAATAHES